MKNMASVWVDIDLKEVDDGDLIDELENRWFNERELKQLCEIFKDKAGAKMRFFITVMDRFTLSELQEMFKEDLSVIKIPKEQLSIFNAEWE